MRRTVRTKLGLAVAVVAALAAIVPATASADTAYVCYANFHVAPVGAIEGTSPQLIRATGVAPTLFPPYPWTYAPGTTPAVAVLTSSLPAAFAANPAWAGVKAGNYTLLCNILALFPSAKIAPGMLINDNGQVVPAPFVNTVLFGARPIPGYHEVWTTS